MASIPARRMLAITGAAAGRPCLMRAAVARGISNSYAAFSSVATTTTIRTGARRHPRWREPDPRKKPADARWSSTSATGSKIWTFEEIQSLSSSPSSPSSTPKPTLIDVREPSELRNTGRIPGALNVPITTAPESFHLSPSEFEDRHGFPLPGKDAELVFYCKAGVRSRAAAALAREAGFRNVGEYPGSWVEWSAKGGEVER